MRTIPRLLAGLALLALARPAPADVRWGGDLGLSMNRRDEWGAGRHLGATSWWFAGALRLDASFFTPGTLDLGASASYLGYRAVGGNASDGLNYQLRVGALARSPISLAASAGRSTVDFTADTSGSRVGTTRVDSVSGGATWHASDTPYLSTAVRHTATVNRPAGGVAVRSDTTSLDAEASQSLEALNYSIAYGTGWSSGDYAETNYRNHRASIRAQAELATNVTTQVMATYDLRLPTLVSPLNPRLDSQTLSSWLQWSAAGASGGGGYSYASALFEAPGEPLRQFVSHAVSGYGSMPLGRGLSLDLNAGGSATLTRVDTTQARATGEQAGVGLRWAGQLGEYAAQSALSGSGGLFQPSEGPGSSAWGIAAGASASRPLGTWYGSLGLSGAFDRNTGASAGDRTRLLASLGTSGTPRGWTLSSMLTGSYSRARSPSFGAARQVNTRLDLQAGRSGYNLGLNLGSTDDLSELLVPGGVPAGALVPLQFNTRSRFAMASATVPTFQQLYLSFLARYVTVASPGRPDQWESGFSVSAGYAIGAFQLTLYDQVSTGGSGVASSGTQNLVFLSISRSFGR
jgi:hypothetical protein